MKKLLMMTTIAVSLFAVDYTSMSLDELSSLRGTVASEDRDAFRSAYSDKIKYLTPEQQANYNRGNGQGVMNQQMIQERKQIKMQQRLQDGSGAGGMYQGSKGFGGKGGGR